MTISSASGRRGGGSGRTAAARWSSNGRGPAYTADMMGRILPVRVEQGELSFDLPDGQGTFRGKPQAGGDRSASGSLRAEGHGRGTRRRCSTDPGWPEPMERRPVAPFDDVFTFHLMVQKRADGSLGALLRNPERDCGAQIGAERLARDGTVVKLMGKRRAETEERELATGAYDAENAVITLAFPVPRRDLRFHARRGRERLLSARQEPGPLRLPPAPGPRRRRGPRGLSTRRASTARPWRRSSRRSSTCRWTRWTPRRSTAF